MTASKSETTGATLPEREMIAAWLGRLALLVAPNMTPQEIRARSAAMVAVLEGQHDQRIWSAEVLRDCATRFKFFPAYAELAPILAMWGSVFRVRDNPAITARVQRQMARLTGTHSTDAAPLAIAAGAHMRVVK